MHTQMHVYVHTCIHMHVKHDKTWMPTCQWPFAFSIHVFACMCVHVCTCGDTPNAPRCLQTHQPTHLPLPEPQGAQITKIQ